MLAFLVAQMAHQQRFARLRVQDNGAGIEEAVQRRIFEPFFTTKATGRGAGLGLSVVHGIVSQMNGTISVRSRVGEGTTFEILFPEALLEGSSEKDDETTPVKGAGLRVLYIDDEEALVYLANRMLSARGFLFTGFARPEDALNAFRERPEDFDLVVTDFNMPRISGLQVATEIAKLRPKLPVMMTSGYITDELREKAAAAGVHHLIEKPDTIDHLCDSVADLLANKRR